MTVTREVQLKDPPRRVGLVEKFAARFSLDADKLLSILRATAFKTSPNAGPATTEQMAALLVVADQYGLNPFTREIFAFEDRNKGVVPVVSVDGWSRIINDDKRFDGVEFVYPETTDRLADADRQAYEWIECVIYRKDRDHPTRVREYFDEVYVPPRGKDKIRGPWQSHPKRMHRHKALIQCARVAFGFAGIYDEDEAMRIIDMDDVPPATTEAKPATGMAAVRAAATKARAPATVDQPPDDPPAVQAGPGDVAEGAVAQPHTPPEETQQDPISDGDDGVADARAQAIVDWSAQCAEFVSKDALAAWATAKVPADIRDTDGFARAFAAALKRIKAK